MGVRRGYPVQRRQKQRGTYMSEGRNIPELFGSNVFNDAAMRDHLPKRVYEKLQNTIDAY